MPTLGTEVFAPGMSLHAGGGAFITGATLASLGHQVSQFSVLPAPPFDSIVSADLSAHHVGISTCKPSETGIDPQITVAISCDGDRAFLTRNDGPATPPRESINFSDYAHLHIGELRTLQDDPELIDAARNAGMTISLDCGWQDTYNPEVSSLIAAVDVFLPNEAEEAALIAIGVPQPCAPLTVVKQGQAGARARRTNDTSWTNNTGSTVTALDSTGAGDSFNAGFLSFWLDNAPLDLCLSEGNACGSAAVQAVGGTGFLK
jgi:sugar/nucleoside kinase (ribokinase family)